MNDVIKRELISALITFVSTFLLVAGDQLAIHGGVAITTSVIVAIVMAAFRAAVKAVAGQFGK